jgi:hypothetical protein
MSRVVVVEGELYLEERPLVDGAELELLVAGGRWMPVRWKQGSCVLTIGGDWEQHTDGSGPQIALTGLDISQAELRRAESPARAARVVALASWIESLAPNVGPDTPVDLDLVRANRKYAAELPRAIEEYQLRLRNHSWDLFQAATLFGAAHTRGADSEIPSLREQLEKAALQFEETSRWLAALQMMQADQG